MNHSSDDQILARPIIVFGAPRSGTTIVSRVLAAHPGVVFLNEPRLTWRYGNDGKTDLLGVDDARSEVRDHIRREFARRVRKAGGDRLLEKSPANSIRGPFVDRVFPDCLFVHIIRNGVDASASITERWRRRAAGIRNLEPGGSSHGRTPLFTERRRELNWRRAHHYAPELLRRLAPAWATAVTGPPLWGPRIPGLSEMARSLTLVEVAGVQWRTCVEAACHFGRQLPSGRYFEMRFEELDDGPVRELARFCDVEPDKGPLDYWRQHARPPGHRALAADDADRLQRWIGPTLQWLGYQ